MKAEKQQESCVGIVECRSSIISLRRPAKVFRGQGHQASETGGMGKSGKAGWPVKGA